MASRLRRLSQGLNTARSVHSRITDPGWRTNNFGILTPLGVTIGSSTPFCIFLRVDLNEIQPYFQWIGSIVDWNGYFNVANWIYSVLEGIENCFLDVFKKNISKTYSNKVCCISLELYYEIFYVHYSHWWCTSDRIRGVSEINY